MSAEIAVTILCGASLLFLCWIAILQVRVKEMEKDIKVMKNYISAIKK